MNSNKMLWTGLTFVIALAPALTVIGLSPASNVLVLVGAVIMVIGMIMLWLDR